MENQPTKLLDRYLFRPDLTLSNKWWHRFFKVLFFATTLLFLLVSFAIIFSSLPSTKNNSTFISLRDFTKNSSEEIDNTISEFTSLKGEVGCLNSTTSYIGYIPSNILKEDGVCNANIQKNIDKIVNLTLQNKAYKNLTTDKAKELMQKVLDSDAERRYCFIPTSIECSSDNIVSYRHNLLFYLEVAFLALVATITWFIIIIFIYYKGFIYIIYGKKK